MTPEARARLDAIRRLDDAMLFVTKRHEQQRETCRCPDCDRAFLLSLLPPATPSDECHHCNNEALNQCRALLRQYVAASSGAEPALVEAALRWYDALNRRASVVLAGARPSREIERAVEEAERRLVTEAEEYKNAAARGAAAPEPKE